MSPKKGAAARPLWDTKTMVAKRMSLLLILLFGAATAIAAGAQTSARQTQPTPPTQAQPPEPPPPIISPDVHEDRTVSFRFRDPNAKEVELNLEGAKPALMRKDDQGVWSVTTEPLEADYYGYSFDADGVDLVDPSNPALLKPNLLHLSNMVHVPGTALWETENVPHGVIHHHFYHSAVVGDDRDYYVYTPPGYDDASNLTTFYPVLYLLHGYSDDASAWTVVGRANVILDNLIAQHKTTPMLIVMTLGYGAPEIVRRGFQAFRDPGLVRRNMDRFRDALITEVIPQVEKSYRVLGDGNHRAIAGLSMGGAESLYVGLNNLDHFSWIGSFSAGGLSDSYDAEFPGLDSKANSQIHLLWIACGRDDRLLEPNHKFQGWLKSKGVGFGVVETPGAHVWMVWRRNLITFAPLLFQSVTP
ncbi:MAG TPA: alpha/beta hydrolase-fold protein [Terriglobia bacterium]